MANSLELQVSLGLQEAQKQIQSLRETLLKSVQMDSTAFKTTNDFLEKLKNRADELKGKMESAFKTSSDSKKYLKDYENLLTNLKTATEKFSTFNLDDFILTDTEKKQIDELRDKIKQLQQDLTNLRKGTIGNFFDDSTVQNADKVKHAAEKLGLSIENLTFSGLSSTFEKEMSKVDKLIEKSEEKLQSLQGQLNTLSTNKVSTIRDDIQKAFDAATTGKSFKTDTTDYQELLKNFYSGFENYSGQKTNNIKAGSNVQDFINSEVDAIIKGCEQMRQRIPEYQKLQQEILNAYKTAPSANASKEAIQNVLKQYNVEDLFKDIDISQNYAKYFGAIKARFKTLFVDTGLMDESTINQLQTNMVAGIQHIFDNADLTTNINTSAFKSQVSNILKNSGLNLNSQEIGAITNAIVKGFDLSALLDNTDKVMEQYRDRVQSEADTTKQTLDDLNEKKKELNEADNTVNSDEVNNKRAENYQKTQEAASGAAKALHDVAEAHQQEAAAAAGNAGSNEDAIRVHEQAVAAIRGHIDSLTNLERKQKSLSNIQMAVDRWMGFWQVLNLTKTAINDMKKHIQELDTVMTSIAVVTNMSQDDLWGQISRYSEIARQYGVAIKGVYEVSQIYYQQGLQSNDVMTLTTETLKMARIAGLDYATAADYMTTAIRGFKLEMQDAGHVTDVFSALAATTASSTEELAVAISKTAASAEAVGSSFEATTAMMATMIATTRESATNIGTALKSVISRYGEMTADPTALRDSEGEEMSLNRVDAALQTVGITIHDTAGQFRDFDDVLLELMEKWDSLDSLSQRYIATLMAGNRQQSRFLALVSNVDEYRKALQTANDAAGTGDLQTLKTLDSIDAKIERMKVTIQEFYTSSGIQDLYKNILDTITNVVSAGNSLPKVFGKIPGLAIAVAGSLISIVKSAATIILNHISNGLSSVSDNFANMISKMVIVAQDGGAQAGKQFSIQFNNATQTMGSTLKNTLTGSIRSVLSTIGSGLSLIGGGITLQGLSKYGSSTNADEDRSAGTTTRNGALLSIVGKTISGIAMGGAGGAAVSGGILTVPAAIIGGITGLTSGLVENFATLTSAHEMLNVSISRQIELADKAASQAQEEVIRAKGEEKALSQAYNQLKELEAARYDSIEAEQAYKDQMNQLRDSYPSLVESIDQAGNAIITTKTLEEQLAAARQKTSTATIGSIEAELKKLETQKEAYNRLFDLGFSEDYNNSQNVIHGWLQDHYQGYDSTESHAGYDYNLLKWYGEQTGRDFTSVLNSGDSKLWQKAIFTNYIDIYQKLAQSMTSSLDEFGGYDNFIATNLSYYLNEIAKATNISLDELTEIENFDTNLLFDLKGEKLIELIKVIQQHASEHINSITETYENIDNTLQYEKTKKDVNSYLDQLKNSPDIIEQQLYNQIKDYSSFISFVFDSKFGSYIDMNAGDNTKYRNEIATWVSQHQSLASSLMQADYNSYRSMIDFYKDFEGVKGSVVDAGWKEQFEKLRKEATDGLSQQLNNIFGINSELFKNLFNDKIEEKDGELTTQNISYLRAGLTHYQDLIKDGQHAAASAYLNSLNQVFNQIGALDSFKQTQIAPIISSLDFTNSESLTKAAEQLQSMGGFDDLVNELNDAATRLMYNVGAMTQRLQASLQETIENVEKAAENAGKGVKYSEAYKNAADILTKYDGTEELVFDDIYQYNEAVGGYLLTRRGLELQLSQQSADVAKEIEDAKTQASTMYNFLDSSYFNQKYVTNFADEDWRKSQVSSFKTTFGISESEAEAYLTQMQEIYEGYDGSIDWDIYIQEQKDNYEKLMQVNEDMYQSLVKNSIGISIVSLDYTKIANGEGNYLKDTLAAQLKQIGLNINNYWADLLEGDVSSLNQALSEAGIDAQVSLAAQKASIQANAEQYHTALKELLDPSITSLSETTTALLEEQGYTQTDLKDPEIFNEVINNLRAHIGSMIDGVLFTLEDYNKIIADSITTNLGGGKEKAVIDMVQGGFTVSELESYANQYKLELSDFFDETTNTFTNSALAAIYHYNPETDTFEANANASAEQIITVLAAAFGVKLEDFTDFATETIDSQIAQRAKDNKGKQIASQLQNLSSAKIGDEVNISSLTDNMKQVLLDNGYITSLTQETFTVESTARTENLLLLLKSSVEAYDEEGKEALLNVYNDINKNIVSKRNKYAATSKIITERFSLSDVENLLVAYGGDPYTAVQQLQGLGIEYNNWTEEFVINSQQDIDRLLAFVNALPDIQSHPEEYNNLIAQINNLRYSIQNKQYNAVQDLVSNYQDLSEESIAAFQTAFANWGINIREFIHTDEWGHNRVDLAGLNKRLAQVGYDVNELFQQEIAAIGDSYLQNISTGVSLLSSGTNNLADLGSFVENYNQLLNKNLQIENVSYYDDILGAFTIRPEYIKEYIEAQAQQLKDIGILPKSKIDQWVKDNTIKAAQENIDISSFLSSDRTQDDVNKLGHAIQILLESYGGSIEESISTVQDNIQILLRGGQDAVNIAKALKPNLTESELAEIYSNAINRWNDALDKVENVVVGSVVTGELRQVLASLKMVDKNGVVTSVKGMVDVYAAIYQQMKETAGGTQADLNNAYAKLLTANDQGRIDAQEALQNAANMSFDTLAQLYNSYGKDMETQLKGLLTDWSGKGPAAQLTGFGGIRIFDIDAFLASLGLNAQSSEYYQLRNEYADAMTEFYNSTNTIIDNTVEQIKGLAEAKPGKAINVSYLESVLGKDALESLMEGYGQRVQDGIYQLDVGADIPGLIQKVAEAAAKAGAIIPEQMAELADTIADVLSQITSLISGGISGNLKNADTFKLQQWATDNGVGQLDFEPTVDGFRLANESAEALIDKISTLNSFSGDSLFNELADYYKETREEFNDATSNSAYVKSLKEELQYEKELVEAQKQYDKLQNGEQPYIAAFEGLRGNVNMYARPWIDNPDGTHSSLLSTAYENVNLGETEAHILMTPVPEWAKEPEEILSEDELNQYFDSLMAKNPISIQALMDLDKQGLEVNGKYIKNMLIDVKDAATTTVAELRAEEDALHNNSDAWEKVRQGKETPDNGERIQALEHELLLAERINMARATTEDDSFKFMENKIPSGQNNPLNYWKNWTTAFEKMRATTSGADKGLMAYEDFYNIVTEMGKIAELSNIPIQLGKETLSNMQDAADLLLRASGTLSNMSTGDMGVTLSEFGINFASGIDGLSENVDAGIDKFADEQIKMLDSMIGLLETIAAMEQLGDIDVDENGLDFGDLFLKTFNADTQAWEIDWTQFNENYDNFIKYVKDHIDEKSENYNEDLANAIKNGKIKLKGSEVFTIEDMINMDPNELSSHAEDGLGDAYAAILKAYRAAAESNTWDNDDLYNSIRTELAGKGLTGSYDLGDLHLVFSCNEVLQLNTNGKYIIDGKESQFGEGQEESAVRAMAAASFTNLLSKDYIIDDTGKVTYHGAIDTTVEYDINSQQYIATFPNDNYTITAQDRTGLALGIKTHALITGTDLENSNEQNTDSTISFRIKQGASAVVDVTVNTETGEITYVPPLEAQIDGDTQNLMKDLELHKEATITAAKEYKVTQDVESGTNEVADNDIPGNKQLGEENPVTQDINIGENAVKTALLENIAIANRGVTQTITTRVVNSLSNNNRDDAIDEFGRVAGSKGNVALAQGTLMGELGPELYVTGGHYYIAGRNGAEFVNLPDDAIVFNHLQTRRLMSTGTSSRGTPTTNEKNAVSFATGNWNGGEARASVQSAISTLKKIRAMWKSLQNLSAKDLAGAGGSGGGGGGGSDSEANKAFLKELERWYNWLQEIAKLEKDITYQEQLRSKIQSDMVAHGQDYAQSQMVTLKDLEQSIAVRQDLVNSQQEYFEKRKNELNNESPFSTLYTFDAQGQLKYQPGQFEALSDLMGTNQYGEANYTAEEQYNKIVAMNDKFAEWMNYNENGEKIKWEKNEDGTWKEEDYATAVENFWNKIDSDNEEMQSLYDAIEEGKTNILADMESVNEILQDIEDNQIDVENAVYEALVDSRERAIEELENTKDAIEDSANKLIDGLQEQLENERDMYEAQDNKDELIKLQRQLSILQRSGASTSEMASLQAQITQKQQDNYFEEQQRQIDAIQEASNNELEKLQQQIDLETEMLAYEKENGLLWSQVYDIMHGNNAEGIAAYIKENNSSMWGKSPTEQMKLDRENLFKTQYYKEYEKIEGGLQALVNHFTDTEAGIEDNPEKAEAFTNEINGGSKSNNSSGSETKGTASGTVSNTGGTWKSDDTGWWYQYNGGSWATGWKNIDGKDYYFNDKGYMQTGWVQGSDGKWYYLGADGAMVTGTQSIDGKTWNFDENGVWDGKDGVAESTSSGSDTKYKATYTVYDSAGNTTSLGGYGVGDTPEAAKSAAKALGEEKIAKRKNYSYVVHDAQAYEQGGLNKYTGISILHGTKTDPEAVLNASQTHILRDEILSNKPNSLLSLLSAWRDSVIGLADTSNINTNYDNGITIEKAEVIMQVHQIANDYDAQRAGEQALDKIMGIARKTIAQNRIGR